MLWQKAAAGKVRAVTRGSAGGTSAGMSGEFEELRRVVRASLKTQDDELTDIVSAVAGLLVTVAYADRDHSAEESAEIARQLARIPGLGEAGVPAIAEVLGRHARPLSSLHVQRCTRILREQADEPMRYELLDVLLAVAAADGTISHQEIVSLRTLTTALGLSQAHYNQLQQKYGSKLHFS
jgi:uncharacterized tellurite resistance protein B-like protein